MSKQEQLYTFRLVPSFSEPKILYQFSNTMLSTISLNKLIHLVLTALVAENISLFERSMLFMSNERSGTLQGMLGVTLADFNYRMNVTDDEDSLTSRWEIGDDLIEWQLSSAFNQKVRVSRIDITCECPVIETVINQKRTSRFLHTDCLDCTICNFLKKLGITNVEFAAAPLIARNKILGMLVVDNPVSLKPISETELRILQLFANQAGMAMENSMLYISIDNARSNLKDAHESLLHAERLAAIGEMAANLAHELKNPLVTIGGFAARLLKNMPEDGTEFHYADTIVKEVKRLEWMLADILAFSRKPTLCFANSDLKTIINDCLDSCITALEEHRINLILKGLDKSLPILGDQYQLQQVFINLILNACDAMKNGGVLTINAQTSSSEHHAAKIEIQLADTGGGIPEELLPQIFTPFFTTKQHGTGLGLAIVNRILLNHHGKISVKNENGGAVFTVTLPLS